MAYCRKPLIVAYALHVHVCFSKGFGSGRTEFAVRQTHSDVIAG